VFRHGRQAVRPVVVACVLMAVKVVVPVRVAEPLVATVVAPDAKPSVLLVLDSAIYGTIQHQKHKQM